MKFNCIKSNTTLSGHDAIFSLLRANKDNGKHIFIVPDRYTLSIEKAVCEEVFEDGSFFVDVYTFTRLAQKALGKFNKKTLSKEGTVLLMNRVLRENNEKLNYYKDVKSLAFSREMFASIASLRSSNVSFTHIEQNLDKFSGTTKSKLKDISIIYGEYEKALKEQYFDTVTRVGWLIDNAKDVDFIRESDIYILGFNVFSNQQLEVIKTLLKVAKSVSIAFCVDSGGTNNALFLDRQMDVISDFCAKNFIEQKIINTGEVLKPPFDKLHREMFGFAKADENYVEKTDNVRIYGATSPYDEIKAVAKEISYLVFNENYRYKDFAVVCDQENMVGIIQEIFDRCEIPHFVDRKYYVKDGFFAKYVNSAFTVIDENFSKKAVFSFMRNPYNGLSRKEIQIFENYCEKFNCNYSAFLQKFTLNNEGKDEYERVIAESVRERIIPKLYSIKLKDSVENYCNYIINKANDGEILKISEKYLQKEDIELKVYAKLQPISEVAEEIKNLCKNDFLTIREFLSTFNSVIENMTESVLPQYLDSVFVGSQSDSRFSQIKAMFIVGANDGSFPKTFGDKLVLGYYDAELMKKNGLPIFPTPMENNAFEQFNVIDLVVKANRLYITYTVIGDDGGYSAGVREIKYRLNIEEKPFYAHHQLDGDGLLAYNLVNVKNCYYEYVSGDVPSEYEQAVKEYLKGNGLLSEIDDSAQELELLRGYELNDKNEYKLSVSKMETYFACPYKNYLRNVLKIEEKEQGELRVNDKGNIIHDVLEEYFKQDIKVLRNGSEEELKQLAEECIENALNQEKYIRFFEGEEGKLERYGIVKESRVILRELTKALRNSSFNPKYLEKYFGAESEITLNVDGKVFSFSGFIDRVDVDENNNIIVVDYKTGKVKEQLSYVYTGQKIQLYLYLKYFLEKGYNPSGVFYAPIPDGYKDGGNRYAWRGQIKDGYNALYSLDNAIKDAPNGKYKSLNIDINTEKLGETVKYSSQNKNVLSELDFRTIVDYVIKLCEQAIRDIIAGDIDKNPVKDGCKYCAYRNLCGDVKERAGVDINSTNFYLGQSSELGQGNEDGN